MPVGFGYVQGYNAHAAVNEQQIVLAAEITNTSTDFSQLDPMTTATLAELQRGRGQRVARGGGRRCRLLQRAAHGRGDRQQAHPGADPARAAAAPHAGPGSAGATPGCGGSWPQLGRLIYRKRKQTIQPPFGHTKHNRAVNRFHRPGRTAVRTEWRSLMATHNLTKLHRHHLAAVGP
jgi:hypothetical protein